MKENLLSLFKEIDMQVREANRLPRNLDPRRNIPWHIIIPLPNIEDEEGILKAWTQKESFLQRGTLNSSS